MEGTDRIGDSGALRAFLRQLVATDEVFVCETQLSPVHEAAAAIAEIDRTTGKVALLECIEGYSVPVVANIYGKRERLATLLGADDIASYCLSRMHRPIDIELEDSVPSQEVVYQGKSVDLCSIMPVLTHYEGDAGPYITVGMVIAKDLHRDALIMGVHRLQVKGTSKLGVLLASPPLSKCFEEAERAGIPLEIAVAIGVDPILLFASVLWAPEGLDKARLAGGLAGRPMKFGKGVTVNVPVPADAEFVIEGRIVPGTRESEGPFGEETGIYSRAMSPVVEVTAITSRRAPLYQALVPFTGEGRVLMSAAWEVAYWRKVREAFPSIRRVCVSPLDWTTVIVQVDKNGQQEAKRVIDFLFSLSPYIKSVIVVDEDVDPASPADVAWAVSTRCQPSEDVVIKSGLAGSAIDPSRKADGSTSKIGFDATVPRGCEERFKRIRFPEKAKGKARLTVGIPGCLFGYGGEERGSSEYV